MNGDVFMTYVYRKAIDFLVWRVILGWSFTLHITDDYVERKLHKSFVATQQITNKFLTAHRH